MNQAFGRVFSALGLDVLSEEFEGIIFVGMFFITVIKTCLCNSECVPRYQLMFRLAFTIKRLISFSCGEKRGMFGCQRKVATS